MPAPHPFLPFSSNSGACPLLITHWKPGPSSSEPSCCHSDFCPQSSFLPQNSTFLACWVVLSLLSTLPWGWGAVTILPITHTGRLLRPWQREGPLGHFRKPLPIAELCSLTPPMLPRACLYFTVLKSWLPGVECTPR